MYFVVMQRKETSKKKLQLQLCIPQSRNLRLTVVIKLPLFVEFFLLLFYFCLESSDMFTLVSLLSCSISKLLSNFIGSVTFLLFGLSVSRSLGRSVINTLKGEKLLCHVPVK